VEELSLALENLQAYNNVLHVLYDQLHPNVPSEVAEMGASAAGAGEEGHYGDFVTPKITFCDL
jgi:hypothetical protein